MPEDDLGRSLAQLLGHLVGDSARVEGLKRLSGGASRETWAFDLIGSGGSRALILQRLRQGASTRPGSLSVAGEVELLRMAHESGVSVPQVLYSDEAAVLGSPGMVVERLDGETIPRKLLRDEEWAGARARLCKQVAGALAAIHQIPPDRVPGLPVGDPLDQQREMIDVLVEPHPAFELGLRWLEAHRPAGVEQRVVHGDLRLGNLLVDHDGLRAVLDWELAHLGDPVEDLGWFCVRAWRFGCPLPAGGLAGREELLDAYRAASGRHVDPASLRWWEMFGTLRWGVICVLQAWSHLQGLSRSVELAAIGRRVCENEWDLLALLPGDALPRRSVDPAPVTDTLHDRPTAVELVEAVREWLDRDVRSQAQGRLSFHARVAANALETVERELALEPHLTRAHRERLASLGCADDAELAGRIRAGQFDSRAAEVRHLLAASVHDKLLVANPDWLAGADSA